MQRHNGDNIGTYHTLYIAKVKDLTSVNFDAQKFTEIYFTAQTGQWQRKNKASKNGNYYESNLAFEVPKYRNEVEQFLLNYVRVGLIAYIVLTNGEFVRIGSLQSPLFILADTEAGKNYADFNSYAFKGTANEAINMLKNSAIVVMPPIPPPPPIILAEGLKFNGDGHYVQHPQLNLGTINSFIIWFKFNSIRSDFNAIVNTLIGSRYMFATNPTQIMINYGGNFGVLNFAFATGILYNLCIVRNENTHNIYINGNFIGSINIITALPSLYEIIAGDIVFGQYYSNIDVYDFKIFNKTLTQAEITELFNNKTIPITALANTLANYEFKEKTGTIIYDTSGNNFHGNMINYEPQQYNLGTDNHHVDENGKPVLS